MLLAPQKRGNLPKWPHVAPPTLRAMDFIQICSNFIGSTFVIHITYYTEVSSFLIISTQPHGHKTKQKSKISLASCPRMKAMFICQLDLLNVVLLTSNVQRQNIWQSSSPLYNWIQRKKKSTKEIKISTRARGAIIWNVKA